MFPGSISRFQGQLAVFLSSVLSHVLMNHTFLPLLVFTDALFKTWLSERHCILVLVRDWIWWNHTDSIKPFSLGLIVVFTTSWITPGTDLLRSVILSSNICVCFSFSWTFPMYEWLKVFFLTGLKIHWLECDYPHTHSLLYMDCRWCMVYHMLVLLFHGDQLWRCSLAVFCWGTTKEPYRAQFPLSPGQIPATRLWFAQHISGSPPYQPDGEVE